MPGIGMTDLADVSRAGLGKAEITVMIQIFNGGLGGAVIVRIHVLPHILSKNNTEAGGRIFVLVDIADADITLDRDGGGIHGKHWEGKAGLAEVGHDHGAALGRGFLSHVCHSPAGFERPSGIGEGGDGLDQILGCIQLDLAVGTAVIAGERIYLTLGKKEIGSVGIFPVFLTLAMWVMAMGAFALPASML